MVGPDIYPVSQMKFISSPAWYCTFSVSSEMWAWRTSGSFWQAEKKNQKQSKMFFQVLSNLPYTKWWSYHSETEKPVRCSTAGETGASVTVSFLLMPQNPSPTEWTVLTDLFLEQNWVTGHHSRGSQHDLMGGLVEGMLGAVNTTWQVTKRTDTDCPHWV